MVSAARRENFGTTGYIGATPMNPVSCNAVVATVFAGAATAFATGFAVIAARHHFGHHEGAETVVEGVRIGPDSLDGLIGARLGALAVV
ncbi:hypothetical protein [Amycolatopsis sp. NPDC021455]|uniref:hypothetical protein n=1 Tax=Amycolatopsis sp. NPDC021455 TaxID=3154901 RepID=UPI0033D9A849